MYQSNSNDDFQSGQMNSTQFRKQHLRKKESLTYGYSPQIRVETSPSINPASMPMQYNQKARAHNSPYASIQMNDRSSPGTSNFYSRGLETDWSPARKIRPSNHRSPYRSTSSWQKPSTIHEQYESSNPPRSPSKLESLRQKNSLQSPSNNNQLYYKSSSQMYSPFKSGKSQKPASVSYQSQSPIAQKVPLQKQSLF